MHMNRFSVTKSYYIINIGSKGKSFLTMRLYLHVNICIYMEIKNNNNNNLVKCVYAARINL